MQKSNSLTVNYLYNVVYKVLTLITPLITTPYVSRVLGVENIGIYNYTYSVVSYFVLFGVLGYQMYGQREIAYTNRDLKKRTETFWEIVWSRACNVILVTTIYLIFAINSAYRLIYTIFILELIANAIDISWYYYGAEKFKTITIRNILVKLIGILCIFFFVRNEGQLFIYVFCHVIVLLIGNITLWIDIKKEINTFIGPAKNSFRHFKPAVIFFIPQCLDSIYMLMDKVMLGNMSSMIQVGLYGQADKIIKMVVTVITSLGLVVSPRIAQCYAIGDEKTLKKYMYKSFGFVFVIGIPMMFGLVGVSKNFSSWFFGLEYDGVETLMSLMSPIVVFMGLNSVMGWQYMMTVGREKDFIKSVAAGAVVNFILNSILIGKYDAIGAVIASVLSMFIMSCINFKMISDIINVKKVFALALRPFICGALMLCAITFIAKFINDVLIGTLIQCASGVIIYFLLEILANDKVFKEYIVDILSFFKK
ncbi:flippase [Faecalibacterium sp. An192]|uniref:flippase n=1 Tax=Faecalibacterium sp. An192 TaxID=1965581 RepID=UPI000B394636|nr:flippase [Faecalibacterium sp. An192]OUP26460.1 hypothetical protein B5F27_13495 [Faecalibacterium sp. An192]